MIDMFESERKGVFSKHDAIWRLEMWSCQRSVSVLVW